MKKRNFILAALSATMLLAGCSGGNNNNSSVDSQGDSSAPIDSTKRKAALSAFVKNIAPNNVTMNLSVSGGSDDESLTYYYMGADAFVLDDGENSQGILANKDQGFFLFTIEDGALNLHGCQGLGNDITTYFTTPSGVFGDTSLYQYVDLETEGYVYDFDTKQMIKDLTTYMSKGTGSTCLYFLLNLMGSSGNYYKYVSSAKLTLSEDGSSGEMSVKLASGKTVLTYTASFSSFGTTSVKAVSDFLAEGKDIPTPTGWDEDCQAAISAVFKDKADDIIFPSGLVNAAFNQQALVYTGEDDSSSESYKYAGLQWTSYGKDLTVSYGKMLADAGYDYVGSQVSSSDGYTHFYYQKELTAQSEDSGAVYIQVDWYYYSSLSEFTCQIYSAVDAMRYTYSSVADANAKIATFNAVAAYPVPTLIESDTIKGDIELADFTAIYAEEYGYSYYFAVDLTFASEEEALAYGEAYIKTLASASYSDTGKYDWDEDGAVMYGAGVSGTSYAALISVLTGKTTTGDYIVEIQAVGA